MLPMCEEKKRKKGKVAGCAEKNSPQKLNRLFFHPFFLFAAVAHKQARKASSNVFNLFCFKQT